MITKVLENLHSGKHAVFSLKPQKIFVIVGGIYLLVKQLVPPYLYIWASKVYLAVRFRWEVVNRKSRWCETKDNKSRTGLE